MKINHSFFHESEYLRKLLLDEEYKGENRVAVTRLVITALLVVFANIEAVAAGIPFVKYSLPYVAALLLSIGFLIEIRMLRNLETPRFHFFAGNIQPFYKS